MSVCFQALLTRVAKTGQGAVELLRCGLVGQLIDFQVFDMLPDSDAHRYGDQRKGKIRKNLLFLHSNIDTVCLFLVGLYFYHFTFQQM